MGRVWRQWCRCGVGAVGVRATACKHRRAVQWVVGAISEALLRRLAATRGSGALEELLHGFRVELGISNVQAVVGLRNHHVRLTIQAAFQFQRDHLEYRHAALAADQQHRPIQPAERLAWSGAAYVALAFALPELVRSSVLDGAAKVPIELNDLRFEPMLSHFFNPAVQFNTTVNGTDALGPTGALRGNRFPSAVTSPTTAPDGV